MDALPREAGGSGEAEGGINKKNRRDHYDHDGAYLVKCLSPGKAVHTIHLRW